MRELSSRGASASSMCIRSISSASPPAVGKRSSGAPRSPQRQTLTSRPSRSECQLVFCLLIAPSALASRRSLGRLRSRGGRALGRVLLAPALELLPEVLGERVPLVAGEERLDLAPDRLARALGAEEAPSDLVEVREVLRAELLELVGLEAPAGEFRVAPQLLAIRQVLLGEIEE